MKNGKAVDGNGNGNGNAYETAVTNWRRWESFGNPRAADESMDYYVADTEAVAVCVHSRFSVRFTADVTLSVALVYGTVDVFQWGREDCGTVARRGWFFTDGNGTPLTFPREVPPEYEQFYETARNLIDAGACEPDPAQVSREMWGCTMAEAINAGGGE